MKHPTHHVVQSTRINQITINFLVKGHTENEADTVHTIEQDKTNKKVLLPSEWPIVLRNTPSDKFEIIVHPLDYSAFYDVHALQREYKNFRLDSEGGCQLF